MPKGNEITNTNMVKTDTECKKPRCMGILKNFINVMYIWAFLFFTTFGLIEMDKKRETQSEKYKRHSKYTTTEIRKQSKEMQNQTPDNDYDQRDAGIKWDNNIMNIMRDFIDKNYNGMEKLNNELRMNQQTPKETQNESVNLENGLCRAKIKSGDNSGHQKMNLYDEKITENKKADKPDMDLYVQDKAMEYENMNKIEQISSEIISNVNINILEEQEYENTDEIEEMDNETKMITYNTFLKLVSEQERIGPALVDLKEDVEDFDCFGLRNMFEDSETNSDPIEFGGENRFNKRATNTLKSRGTGTKRHLVEYELCSDKKIEIVPVANTEDFMENGIIIANNLIEENQRNMDTNKKVTKPVIEGSNTEKPTSISKVDLESRDSVRASHSECKISSEKTNLCRHLNKGIEEKIVSKIFYIGHERDFKKRKKL